ncbi:MAG: hypothetical protein ACO1RT_20860 [Planctomycetaceae bacterium]
MASHENYRAPLDIAAESLDSDLAEAHQAWIDGELSEEIDDAVQGPDLAEFADPIETDASEAAGALEQDGEPSLGSEFVGRWHELVSRTNWEKGRIISQWRQSLIAAGAASTQYSDETWAQQVGGVTAPHVGRLRRVFDHYGDTCESYPNLSWTHFLVAMDWDDAPLWLQGASDGRWSVSGMRRQRWETLGGSPEDRPREGDVISGELDEDFVQPGGAEAAAMAPTTQPAQGGGSTKKYAEEPSGISSGPVAEGPDFGDDSLERLPPMASPAQAEMTEEGGGEGALVQPFAGLPALPDDLADAVELLKLAIVRHKASGWNTVDIDTVRSYLSAFLVLIDARSR